LSSATGAAAIKKRSATPAHGRLAERRASAVRSIARAMRTPVAIARKTCGETLRLA
jgi:hypothetical protein